MPGTTIAIDTESRGFFALLALVALLFAWTAMAPCLDNGFTNWDETQYIIYNPKIKTLTPASVREIFTSRDLMMYSPLSTLSYAVNYHFSGLAPKAYHATAIALHLANTLLAMCLVRLLLPGAWPAFLCGLFFGVHPAHVESVAWAAERKDLLYSLFYLLSLCAYTLSLKGRKTYLAAFGLFACSLLSKPMAVTLPLALLLIDYLRQGTVGRKEWLNKIPFFAAAAFFTVVTLQPADAARWAPVARRLCMALYNPAFYAYTLAWPFNLSAMYAQPVAGIKSIYVLAAATLAAAGLLWKFCRRERTVMFGAGLYLAMLLPVLQFFPFGPVISADRYTYLASLGFFIALAAPGAAAWERAGAGGRRGLAALILLAAVTFTVAARVRCAVWKDGITLWSDTLRKQPAAEQALANLCAEYLHAGMHSHAAACLSEAIRQYPGKEDSYYNLGLLLYKKGNLPQAQYYCEQALRLNGRNAKALFILGNIALSRGEAGLAQRLYLRSAECDGTYVSPLRQLGDLAGERKDRDQALEYYERALALDPADPYTLGRAAALRGRP